MLRRTVPMQITALGEREVEIRMMTGGLKEDGYDLVPEGCVLDGYLKNPIQLWQHDPNYPVASNDNVRIEGGGISAHCTFAPVGVSAKADEVCGLVKHGIVRACSIGFDVLEWVPINPRNPQAGRRALRWALFECSFVSVPLDPNAGVTARAGGDAMADWKCGAARDLPIQDGDLAWNGSAAEKAIFEWAGGDEFDTAKARRAFLAYDAGAPDKRGSYKLPFAHPVGGELQVPKSALRAASGAHGVGAADIGGAKKEAQSVLDHYKKKAGVGEDGEEGDGRSRRQRRKPTQRARRGLDETPPPKIRGMYGVAQLAYIVDELSWARSCAEFEAQLEGDQSQVPAMLARALQLLGETLITMTTEEVTELLGAGDEPDGIFDGLSDGERAQVENAKTPALRAFLAGKFRARAVLMSARAGKALSAVNAEKIGQAEGHHAKALEHHADAVAAHANIGDSIRSLFGSVDRINQALSQGGDNGDGDGGSGDGRSRRAAGIERHLNAITGELAAMQDEHEAMGDSHRGIARCVRAAARCLRDLDGYEGEGAITTVQTSSGTEGGGETNRSADHDFRQRQAEVLRLAEPANAA